MFSSKASSAVSSLRRRCLVKLRLKLSGVNGWYVTPACMLKNLPGPGSNGAVHTGGGADPVQRPAVCALRASTAGILTRGKRGPAPKSKSRLPKDLSTNILKLNFLLTFELAKMYRPPFGDERSLSVPQNVHVFSAAQFDPAGRFMPNSSSKTRS